MKTGLTIQQMAQELLRQSKAKQDYTRLKQKHAERRARRMAG